MPTINERVIPFEEMGDFQVAEGDPDVRGWKVYSGDGVLVGEVEELLVDTEALRVRYLDVELTAADGATEERHVLIPIGHGRLHELDDRILIEGLDVEAIQALPAYAQEPLTREYETTLLRHFAPGKAAAPGGTRTRARPTTTPASTARDGAVRHPDQHAITVAPILRRVRGPMSGRARP